MGFHPVDGWLVGRCHEARFFAAICYSSASTIKHMTLHKHQHGCFWFAVRLFAQWSVQGHLAHWKTTTPLGPP